MTPSFFSDEAGLLDVVVGLPLVQLLLAEGLVAAQKAIHLCGVDPRQ